MPLSHAAFLGMLQGLTEILPISSSAHLLLVPILLGWGESGLAFDAALHLGTMIALTVYFRRDIADLAANFISSCIRRSWRTPAERLPLIIVVASVPAAVLGKSFDDTIEAVFRTRPSLTAILLIVFGILLAVSDAVGRKQAKLDRMGFPQGLLIGLAQALALIPGVSRSGITITAALFLGFNRETAARFSFLLSLPIVFGAAILKLMELLRGGIPPGETGALLVGILSSALFGYAGVSFLLRFVRGSSLSLFVWYRVIVGAILLVIFSGGFR